MTITSLPFMLFTVACLMVYYLLPRRPQNFWLLLVSYIFVVSWDWTFAVVLGLVTAVNYRLGKLLVQNGQGQRTWLWVGIGFNVLILIFYRSANFFLPELTTMAGDLGVNVQSDGLQILVPLGLSYYVLSIISYLVDVHRRQLPAETNFWYFALFLVYFPKLIAGPIERAQSFLPKLAQSRVVDHHILARSTLLIFVGLMRKLFIADVLTASFLQDVFDLPAKYTPPELAIWLVVYAFAIYNDFAGYTSIVRGVSGLFGIELASNFQTPYFSRSFTEFWTRWHISLSEWLRDYVYFPISRALRRRNPNQQHASNLILPPLITMLASGIWHGFGLHMLLWGGLHGIYLVIERLITMGRPVRPSQDQSLPLQGVSMLVVFIFVLLAWVPFRWELPAALDFWSALLNWSSFEIRYRRLFLLLPILFVSLVIDFLQYYKKDEFIFLKWPRLVQAGCMALILLMIYIMTAGDFEQPFVYQAF